jgi:hypothetical protein
MAIPTEDENESRGQNVQGGTRARGTVPSAPAKVTVPAAGPRGWPVPCLTRVSRQQTQYFLCCFAAVDFGAPFGGAGQALHVPGQLFSHLKHS